MRKLDGVRDDAHISPPTPSKSGLQTGKNVTYEVWVSRNEMGLTRKGDHQARELFALRCLWQPFGDLGRSPYGPNDRKVTVSKNSSLPSSPWLPCI